MTMQYELTEEEIRLIENYRELYPMHQECIRNIVMGICDVQRIRDGKPLSPSLLRMLNDVRGGDLYSDRKLSDQAPSVGK